MKTRVLLLCTVLLLAAVAASVAQMPPPNTGMVGGAVVAVDASSVTIQTDRGQATFVVTGETAVLFPDHRGTIAEVKVNDKVSIAFFITSTGAKVARTISVMGTIQPPPPPILNACGVVETVDATTLAIKNQMAVVLTFAIDADTRVKLNDQLVPLSEIKVGDRVCVGFQQLADGTKLAKLICIQRLTPPQRPPAVSGKILAVDAASLTIQAASGEVTFVLNSLTRVRFADKPATLADLQVGQTVGVAYQQTETGKIALIIVIIPDKPIPPPPPLLMMGGVVRSVDATSLTIKNDRAEVVTFVIDANTKVRLADKEVPVTEIKVGDRVGVAFQPMADGTKLAKTIVIQRLPPPPPMTMGMAGFVTEVTPDSITIKNERSETVKFAIEPATVVRFMDQTVTVADIKVGDRVQIQFVPVPGGPGVAKLIVIVPPAFSGKITQIVDGGFTMAVRDGSLNVIVGADTKIQSHGYIGTLLDLKVGYPVNVIGKKDGDVVTAFAVNFEPPTIKGIVTAVSGNQIAVKDPAGLAAFVNVTDATVITLVKAATDGPVKIGIADIQPGMMLAAGGVPSGERTIDALWVNVMVKPTLAPR